MEKNRSLLTASALAMLFLLVFSATAAHSIPVAPPTPWAQCPPVGDDAYCQILIVINGDGTVSIYNSTQGPYDGSDDALVGVQDNCPACGGVTTLDLNGSGVFAFDGDGPCSGPNDGNPTPYPPVNECPGGAYQVNDPQDYESNNVTLVSGADSNNGSANFSPALTSGDSAWFGLEGFLTSGEVNITAITTTSISSSTSSSSTSSSSTSSSSSSSSSTSITTTSISPSTSSSSSSSTTTTTTTITTTTITPTGVPQFGASGLSAVFVAAATFVALALVLRFRKPSIPTKAV